MTTSSRRGSRGWFAGAAYQDYSIETRIIGPSVELHARHRPTGQRFISRADRLEAAAEGLIGLIKRAGAEQRERSPAPAPARISQAIRYAAVALSRALRPDCR